MSPESFTNALLITLISLLGFIGGVSIKKINELIKDVRSLLLSDRDNKKDIISLREDVTNLDRRVTALEKNAQHKKDY